jgi:hypothetical protein
MSQKQLRVLVDQVKCSQSFSVWGLDGVCRALLDFREKKIVKFSFRNISSRIFRAKEFSLGQKVATKYFGMKI